MRAASFLPLADCEAVFVSSRLLDRSTKRESQDRKCRSQLLGFCLLSSCVYQTHLSLTVRYDTWRWQHDNKHFYYTVSVKYTLWHQRCGSSLVVICHCSCFIAKATFQISSCSKATRSQQNLINRQRAHVCPHFLFPGNCKSIWLKKNKNNIWQVHCESCVTKVDHEPFRPSQHIKQ